MEFLQTNLEVKIKDFHSYMHGKRGEGCTNNLDHKSPL